MEIRAARESELEQVVELCCIAFNPEGHERYWQYVRGDSSYRLPQTRVVVVNDRVVSTLRVWERRMRVGASIVTMGGIGGVCTHPNYRGVGYASALMRDTIGYLRTTGADVGVLFTIIPEAFYHQLGWTSLPLHGFHTKDVNPCKAGENTNSYNSATRVEGPSEWQVTPFDAGTDLDAVATLHDIATAQQSGTIARTRAYWDMIPSRIRGVLPTVVAHPVGGGCNPEVGGYLNYQIEGKRAEVLEIGCTPDNPAVLEALVSHLQQVCEAQGVEEIHGKFSHQHPFVKRLIAGCEGALTPTKDTAMMLYAVNLPVLLRRLVVGWESRIVDAGETFPPLAVKLPAINNQQAVLRYNADGTLQIVSDGTAACAYDLDLTEAEFWQLLFGEIGGKQIGSNVSVPPEISAFLATLFPKRDVIFWTPDRY